MGYVLYGLVVFVVIWLALDGSHDAARGLFFGLIVVTWLVRKAMHSSERENPEEIQKSRPNPDQSE